MSHTYLSTAMLALLLPLTHSVVPLHAATITRIIGTGDPMPDRPGTVAFVGEQARFDESSGGHKVLVALGEGGFLSGFAALYLVDSANKFQRVVSTETPKPGGGAFAITVTMMMSVYGETVYFTEVDPTTFKTAVYKVAKPGLEPTLVAAQGAAGPNGTYQLLTTVAAHAHGVVFEALVGLPNGDNYSDLFHYDGSTVSKGLLGRLVTPVPGAPGYKFFNVGRLEPQVRNGDVFFLGNGYSFFNIQGLYALPLPGATSQARVIVDTLTDVPGLPPGPGAKFSLPELANFLPGVAFDTDGTRTVFLAKAAENTAHGIYEHDGASVRVAVDGKTSRPGTTDTFKFTGAGYNDTAVAVAGSKIAFRGTDANSMRGIFVQDGATLEEIAMEGASVAGVELFGIKLTRGAFKDNELIFTASNTLWRATLGAAPPPHVSLAIDRTANGITVSWNAQTVGAGAVLEETPSLVAPSWRQVQNQSNPYPVAPSAAERYFRLRQ